VLQFKNGAVYPQKWRAELCCLQLVAVHRRVVVVIVCFSLHSSSIQFIRSLYLDDSSPPLLEIEASIHSINKVRVRIPSLCDFLWRVGGFCQADVGGGGDVYHGIR